MARVVALSFLVQTFSLHAQTLPFRVYTHDDGLPSDQITAVFQDSRGYLWVGTSEGASIFDGKLFRNFSVRDGLGIGQVNHIIESAISPGTIYFALAGGGVASYHDGKFSTTLIDSSFPSNYVIGIVEDSLGALWCTTSAGLYRIAGAHSTLIFPKSDDTFFEIADSIVRTSLHKSFTISDPLREDPAWDIKNIANLPKRGITCSFVDRERVLWIGTDWEGLWKLTSTSFISFPITRTQPGYRNYSPAAVDPNNHVWTASGDGLWEYWQEEEHGWRTFLHPRTSRNSHGWLDGVMTDPAGRLWLVYTEGWLEAFRVTQTGDRSSHLEKILEFSPLLPGTRSAHMDPLSYTFNRAGELIYALPDGGLVIYNVETTPRLLRTYEKHEGVDVGTIFALAVENEGTIWAGSYGAGVLRILPNGIVRHYTKSDGLTDLAIRSLLCDRNGHIWAGTRRGGVAILKGDKFESVSVFDGLISNSVWSLAEDDSGHIWASTSVGLQAINAANGKPLSPRPELTGNWTGASGITSRGELWWYETGIALRIFNYRISTRNSVPPPIYITGINVNGIELVSSGTPELPHDMSNWTMRFVAPSMREPEEVKYRYKLNETEPGWSQPLSERSVTFGALEPGRYTFIVEAINSSGIRSVQPAQFSFIILPPFWSTGWFLSAVGIVLCGAFYAGFRYRLRKLLEIERMRTAIATDLHDDIGTSLTRIALYADASLRDYEVKSGPQPAESSHQIREWLIDIAATSRSLIDAMNDIVWAVDPKNDSLEGVLIRMKTLAARMLDAKGIDYEFHVSENLSDITLPLRERRQFFLVFKEAMNNVIKHAQATNVELRMVRSGQLLRFTLKDNGKGFSATGHREGNGLRNMTERARNIGGTIEISSEPGAGTMVNFTMNIPS